MGASDIKKSKLYSRKKDRPQGAPPEILYLKTNQLECEDNTLIILPEGTKKTGAYGVRVDDRGTWYLIKGILGKMFFWVSSKQVRSVKRWSKILQKELDEVVKEPISKAQVIKKDQHSNQNNQNDQSELNLIPLDTKTLMVMLEINGNKKTLKAKLNGKLLEPIKGFKTVKDYLENEVSIYGEQAVSYEYSFQ